MQKARGFSLIELMIIVALTGILASVAIPSYVRYVHRSETIEAAMNLRRMYDGAVAYYMSDHADNLGIGQNKRFPNSCGPTPATPPKGHPLLVDQSAWATPEWSALSFGVTDPLRYSYTFDNNGETGAKAFSRMIAQGDLDGDGIPSTFFRTCTGEIDGIMGGSALFMIDEIE
jgi:prepilin-type N-terminal cleavage/methylation domain-containing protein